MANPRAAPMVAAAITVPSPSTDPPAAPDSVSAAAAATTEPIASASTASSVVRLTVAENAVAARPRRTKMLDDFIIEIGISRREFVTLRNVYV